MNYRPMPEDFEAHKTEGMQKLMARYHAGQETVRRWKTLCGTYIPHGRGIIGTDANGKVTRYASAKEAAKAYWGYPSSVYYAIRHGGTAWGVTWEYAEE